MSVIRRKSSKGDDTKLIDESKNEIIEEIDHAAEELILLGIKAPKFVKSRKRCLLYPDDGFYIYFDMFISLILLISCMITPLNFAFQTELEGI